MSSSRSWAMMCRDFVEDAGRSKEIIYRHLAWLTALRYQLTASRTWENADKPYNREYKQYYVVPEKKTSLDEELLKYMTRQEMEGILPKNNRATQLPGLQSDALRKLYNDGLIDNFRFLGMHDKLTQFSDHQGRS